MAGFTLSTRLSRRSMLTGGAAAVLPGVAALPRASLAGEGEIAALAARYEQAMAELLDWIDAAERRHGPLAHERRAAYRGRTDALRTRERRATEALARARPASLRGLVRKLRPAFYCETLCEAAPDCDAEILLAALCDLERLAEGEG